MKKAIIAFISLFYTALYADGGGAYEKLVSNTLNMMSLTQKQVIVSSYLFEGSGAVDYGFDQKLYNQAWAESGVADEMVFGLALCQDVKIRVFSSLDLKERTWALRVISLLKQTHLPEEATLPADQYVNKMIRFLADRNKSLMPLDIKVIGDLDSSLPAANKLNTVKYSFFDVFRVIFSSSNQRPIVYLSYPYIVIKGLDAEHLPQSDKP